MMLGALLAMCAASASAFLMASAGVRLPATADAALLGEPRAASRGPRGSLRRDPGRQRGVCMAATVAPEDAPAKESGPSFSNCWYAVALSSQVGTDEPVPLRLWGEPIVLYRDPEGEVVCAKDVCPHRSAPLSMGEIEDGVLRCFYHGWGFGAGAKCVSVPTVSKGVEPGRFCADSLAVTERDGMVWVWRGHTLTADASKLPGDGPAAAIDRLAVDTVLDYACEWDAVVENHLDPSLLSRMHAGSLPALITKGFSANETSAAPRATNEEARYEAPNRVSHSGGRSGYAETFHVIPVAPNRARVLLRQRFPKGPALSAVLQIPGAQPLIEWLVRNANYRISSEAYARREGPSEAGGGFREWKRAAEAADGPDGVYFQRWGGKESRFGPQIDDDAEIGTYGLKRSYTIETPRIEYAPANFDRVSEFTDSWQVATKAALGTAVAAPVLWLGSRALEAITS